MTERSYAQTKENEPPEKWQLLENYLRQVAEISCCFKKLIYGANCKTICHSRMFLSGIWFFRQLEPDSRSESLRE